MPSIALSLSDELEKFGAYAGLVAFFGFAVLIILYFAQAREVKRLREWAGRAPERAAELEARVAADAARRAARPATQPPPPPTPAGPSPATPAGAPAGAPGPGVPAAAVAAPPAEADQDEGGQADGGPEAGTSAGPPAEEGAQGPAVDAPTGGESPAAPAGNGAGAPSGAPPIPRATPGPAGPGAGGPPPRRPAPAAGLRQSPPPARRPGQPPPRRPTPPAPGEERSRARTAIIAASSLVAVVFAVLAAVQIFGGGEERPAPNVPAPAEPTATASPGDEAAEAEAAPARADTTVAVLNGTTVTGLAAQIADDIERAGFVRGATANYSDQARSASLVFYEGEFRRRAQEVARIIDLPAEDVEPMTDDVLSLAGDADVVVVVGADQAP